MKTHVFRLHRGDDLYLSLKNYCRMKGIQAGIVISGVGCVTQGRIRDASGVNIQTLQEHLEIVSLNGTVSEQRCHLHIAFSKEDLSTVGGHLVEGCLINTTCEIAILEFDDLVFSKEFDESTGYHELKISQK